MNKTITQVSVNQQGPQDTIAQIKAISLHQPWASLITLGLKHFEESILAVLESKMKQKVKQEEKERNQDN